MWQEGYEQKGAWQFKHILHNICVQQPRPESARLDWAALGWAVSRVDIVICTNK